MYAAILCSDNSTKPCDWLSSELPHLLDEICVMAASVQLSCMVGDSGVQPVVERDGEESEKNGNPNVTGEGVKLSRAEAKLAWVAVRGDMDRAVRQLLRDRQRKVGTFDMPCFYTSTSEFHHFIWNRPQYETGFNQFYNNIIKNATF